MLITLAKTIQIFRINLRKGNFKKHMIWESIRRNENHKIFSCEDTWKPVKKITKKKPKNLWLYEREKENIKYV